MDNKKVYIVDYESVRGTEIYKAFFDETLAKKFTEAVGSGSIREVEICEEIPEKFMFYVIFGAGEVVESGLWTNADLNDCIVVATPVRTSVIIEAPTLDDAIVIARQQAIDFIRNHDTIMMDVTYRMSDGSVVRPSDYLTAMPMITSMRNQTLALLEGRSHDARIHAVETVLLFWASPSSEDGIYRFKLSDEPSSGHLDIMIPAVTSPENKIEIRRADKDEIIAIARRLDFEVVESKHPDVLCLKRT